MLQKLIHAPELLVGKPGAFDPLSARIAQEAGFPAVQCSGFGISVSRLGPPDLQPPLAVRYGRGHAADSRRHRPAGHGRRRYRFRQCCFNAWYAVKAFERIGCAGVNIEDQVKPKRCGRLEGKSIACRWTKQCVKIRACAEARADPIS
ncbi:hypothetical protein ACU4GD_31450 [Cupriavidus basilensis]